VVFVTAFDRYAMQTFDECVEDYLLKPVQAARLARTVQRLKDRLDSAPADLSSHCNQWKPPPSDNSVT
jgi:two-component SAPR family response regulator